MHCHEPPQINYENKFDTNFSDNKEVDVEDEDEVHVDIWEHRLHVI